METASSPKISLSTGLRSCFSKTRRPRSSGKPASTSVASCRVKVVSTAGFTPPLKKGILMLMLTPPPFFPLGAAFLGAPFLAPFAGSLAASTIFTGNKPMSFTRPIASF